MSNVYDGRPFFPQMPTFTAAKFTFTPEKPMPKTHELETKYIVWNPKANVPPRQTYNDRPEAIRVATAMAHRFPGEEFAVCKIVGVAATSKVTFNSFE